VLPGREAPVRPPARWRTLPWFQIPLDFTLTMPNTPAFLLNVPALLAANTLPVLWLRRFRPAAVTNGNGNVLEPTPASSGQRTAHCRAGGDQPGPPEARALGFEPPSCLVPPLDLVIRRRSPWTVNRGRS